MASRLARTRRLAGGLQDAQRCPSPALLGVVRGSARARSPLVAGLNSEKASVSGRENSAPLSTRCVQWRFFPSRKGEREVMLRPGFLPRHRAQGRFLFLAGNMLQSISY